MNKRILRTAVIPLFSALIAVCTMISVPMPSGVPVTLQTFAAALCGYVLGARSGAIAVGVYIALGAVGLPVFSGFAGGVGKLFGITGGFIFGFLLLVVFCGIASVRKITIRLILSLCGVICCHALGILWFSAVSQNNILAAFITTSLPYLPKDIILCGIAMTLSGCIKKALNRSGLDTDKIK